MLKFALRVSRRRERLVQSFETGKFKHHAVPVPSSVRKACDVTEITIENRKVWTLRPKGKKSSKVVFYFHGGGHVNNIILLHWLFLKKLIQQTGATFVVPDYPLLPDSSYKELYDWVGKVFHQLFATVSSENLILMGDSAGGAISLAFAQMLREINSEKQASQVILISPELDFSVPHPDIPKYAPYDVVLDPVLFNLIAVPYSNGSSRSHYLISPALGKLQEIGKISIFIGTHDILYPYTLDLKQRLEREKIDFNFYEYPRMFHVWAAIPFLKEAESATNQMAALIRNGALTE